MPLSPLHFSQHYKRNTEVINIGEKWNSHLLTKVVAATPFKAVCPFKVPFWLNLKGVNVIIYFLKSEYRIFYIKHPPPPPHFPPFTCISNRQFLFSVFFLCRRLIGTRCLIDKLTVHSLNEIDFGYLVERTLKQINTNESKMCSNKQKTWLF